MSVAPSLQGKTIAITEARRATELATLIRKLGGVPFSAPAVREVRRDDQREAFAALDAICRGDVAVIVFTTGVGARAFLEVAAERGQRDALLTALQQMLVAARGPKPVAVLRDAAVRIDIVPPEPTSESVLGALSTRDLRGRVVAVQLYGEDNPVLVEGLQARGVSVLEIPLYEWELPEDQQPLIGLVHALVAGDVDVIAFTSSPQIKHLVVVAERVGLRDPVLGALRERVCVAAQGPVCTATLASHGIVPAIQPGRGTMGALVHAIAEHVSGRA